MKTNGAVLCVEDLRLAANRWLPLSASASKKKDKNGGKAEQQWRESEANGWGKEQGGEVGWAGGTGDGAGEEGPGSGGAAQGRAVGGTPYSQPRSMGGGEGGGVPLTKFSEEP